MNHPHLLPNELDRLVDGDAGIGVAPLRAHLAECEACRQRHEELRVVGHALDALPHFSPHSRLTDSVMAKVMVVEPWHVPLTTSARHLVPSSGPLRILGGIGAIVLAAAISGGALWLAFGTDLATWALDLFLDRGRAQLAAGASAVAARGLTMLLGGSVLALTCIGAALGFRRLAESARAHRS